MLPGRYFFRDSVQSLQNLRKLENLAKIFQSQSGINAKIIHFDIRKKLPTAPYDMTYQYSEANIFNLKIDDNESI